MILATRWMRLISLTPGELVGYAHSVARGVAANRWKRELSERALHGAYADEIEPASSLDPDEAADLRRALGNLELRTESLFDAIVLAEVVGLTGSELAAAQGVPLGTAKTRLRTARNVLREVLAAEPNIGRRRRRPRVS